MIKKIVTLVILVIVALSLLGLAACSGGASAANGAKNFNTTVKQTSIKPTINGDIVTISLSEVEKYGNVNFKIKTATDIYSFMAYQYGDKTYVRSDVCVPCGSESFTLKNGTLVCDACGTVFNVETGVGVKGVKACQSYTKQPVAFETTGTDIVMKWTDLATSFQNTINRK
jgi:nitrite reductase/ring-hydroxylating ferredoxin subunit